MKREENKEVSCVLEMEMVSSVWLQSGNVLLIEQPAGDGEIQLI